MTIWSRLLRWFFVVALTIYVGGFTFYSVVVIPILHDRLESAFLAGLVTQRVTDALNLLGVATLSLGWCVYCVRAMHRFRSDPPRRWDFWPLLISSIGLVVLLVLHRLLDRKLETGTLAGFYPYHRAYLWVSTVQWFANLGLLTNSSGVFTPSPESPR
jgi:voltage-gated potassium channel Kch